MLRVSKIKPINKYFKAMTRDEIEQQRLVNFQDIRKKTEEVQRRVVISSSVQEVIDLMSEEEDEN
jgi:hypothetical protein